MIEELTWFIGRVIIALVFKIIITILSLIIFKIQNILQ
jgi:hypothetical protein